MSEAVTTRRILATVFTCCPPGKPGFTGGEDILGWNLVQAIAQHHEVWAITHAEDQSSIEQALSENPIDNLHFLYVGMPGFLRAFLKIQGGHQFYNYLWQIKSFFAAKRLHREIKFDLFHHITYANDWMSSFIGALLPIPYVRGPGGGAHRTPKALQTEYTYGGRIWEKVRSVGQWLFRHDPFFIMGHRRASAILLCNNEAITAIPKKWSHKIHLFPVSGVSFKDLEIQTTVASSNDAFLILSAGSLIRIKGFSLAIKAFKQFSDKHPNARFTVAGRGPEESRLNELIDQLGLNGKVHLAGEMLRDDLMQKMASCDVVLFPSLRDGGGTVVVEAMSLGKPVVCIDTGGPGLHITDECGIKVSPTDAETTVNELANGLERLYQDQDLRNTLGLAARKRVNEMYRWDKLGERLIKIYQPLFSENR